MSDDKGMTTGRGAIQRADATQRARQAWARRESGSTWDEVAQLVGYANRANAVRGVRTYFGELPQPQRNDLRELGRNRLERLYGLAHRDAEAVRPGALRAGMAIAQRASALDGLDAPMQVVVSPAAEEFEQVVAALVIAKSAAVPREADIFDAEVEDDESPHGTDVRAPAGARLGIVAPHRLPDGRPLLLAASAGRSPVTSRSAS